MSPQPKRTPLLDLLVDLYPEFSREYLLALVVCGDVLVDAEKVKDPRRRVPRSVAISFVEKRYVSRGGEKLEHALSVWNVEVAGRCFIDAGASTGGFTDALLKRGAAAVHTIDVGYNQLDFRLRRDERVVVHERCNIMEVRDLSPEPHAAVADLSFRSIVTAASRILSLTRERWMIGLVKPQFELRSPHTDFHGVIRNTGMLKTVVYRVVDDLAAEGILIRNTEPSPLKGRKGNVEFLFLLALSDEDGDVTAVQAVKERLADQIDRAEVG